MPQPDRYIRGWRRPVIYDSERAMVKAQEHNYGTSFGRANMVNDALGVLKGFADLHKAYDTTRMGLERQKILGDIQDQLAPNQRVRVVIDPKTNDVLEIARPGAGYLRAVGVRDEDGNMVEKLDYFPLEGDDDGICRSNVRPDTTQFTVPDDEGKPRRIRLFEDNGPEETDIDSDEDGETKSSRHDKVP